MRILLDTNALLFAVAEPERLGARWRVDLLNTANEVYVSSVSAAEVAIKIVIGKLSGTIDLTAATLQRYGLVTLPFTLEHGNAMRTLPLLHRDPFDRMIIAQALVEDLAIMTTDRQFADYGVRLVPE